MAVIMALAMLAIAGLIYFLPTAIASGNGKRNIGAIFAFNLLLGWSGLGWIICLVWSLCED